MKSKKFGDKFSSTVITPNKTTQKSAWSYLHIFGFRAKKGNISAEFNVFV